MCLCIHQNETSKIEDDKVGQLLPWQLMLIWGSSSQCGTIATFPWN
jgi:hypothetical protein